MLKVKRVMMIRDLCKMFNFVQIFCGVISDKRLMKNVYTLTPQSTTNKQASEQAYERASERAEGII